MAFLKRYLIAGVLVWLPLGVTILVINFLMSLFDKTILLIPTQWRPEALLGFFNRFCDRRVGCQFFRWKTD